MTYFRSFRLVLVSYDTEDARFSRLLFGTLIAKKTAEGRGVMEEREEQIGKDLGLVVFVVVAAWLLIFQSGLF